MTSVENGLKIVFPQPQKGANIYVEGRDCVGHIAYEHRTSHLDLNRNSIIAYFTDRGGNFDAGSEKRNSFHGRREVAVERFGAHESTAFRQGTTITQELMPVNGGKMKVHTVENGDRFFQSVRTLSDDGVYTVERLKSLNKNEPAKVIAGYKVKVKIMPSERQFLTGFKGKIEAVAHQIGNTKAGLERGLGLNKLAGLIINTVRKLK